LKKNSQSNRNPNSDKHEILARFISDNHDLDHGTLHNQLSENQWKNLVSIAIEEGVAPLLYWHFNHQDWPDRINEQTKSILVEEYYSNLAYNSLLLNELDRVFLALQKEDIPVVVLKGAVLANSVYPNIGLRPFGDLDLLLPRDSIDKAVQIVKDQLGYTQLKPDVINNLNQFIDYHLVVRGGPGNRVSLEFHWGLVTSMDSWYSVPIEWFWEQTDTLSHLYSMVEDVPSNQMWSNHHTFALTPTAHLLYLLAHSFLQHGRKRTKLIWLFDIHLVISKDNIDWDLLISKANEFQWSPAVHSALQVVEELFGTYIPSFVFSSLTVGHEQRISRLIHLKDELPDMKLLDDWYLLKDLNWLARFRLIFALIFPSSKYIQWRYAPEITWTWPIFYVIRWFNVLRNGYSLMAVLMKDKAGKPKQSNWLI
jgi:hypothetical protein